MILDVHCHLQSSRFDGDRAVTIARAEAAGVTSMLNAATQPADWDAVRSIAKSNPCCKTAFGIHPWYIPADAEAFLSSLTPADFAGASAVGEIGLDAHTQRTPLERQISVFVRQLALAQELALPSIIHCRGAFGELMAAAKRTGLTHGAIVHAFNGSEELAKDLIRHGFTISLGGVITYRDSVKREKMIRAVYPDHFLLETDSPDIVPAEKKGERNEPSFIRFITAAAAQILGIDEDTLIEQARQNAVRILGERIFL